MTDVKMSNEDPSSATGAGKETAEDSDVALKRTVRSLLRYVGETPELLSLLYDMDLMPEQLKERTHDWARMLLLAQAWKNRTQWPNDKLSHGPANNPKP
jgi:hypothetical protein